MFTDQPGVQFYTGNGLDGSPGKGGVEYHKYGAFCLEAQNYPDAINQVSLYSQIKQSWIETLHLMAFGEVFLKRSTAWQQGVLNSRLNGLHWSSNFPEIGPENPIAPFTLMTRVWEFLVEMGRKLSAQLVYYVISEPQKIISSYNVVWFVIWLIIIDRLPFQVLFFTLEKLTSRKQSTNLMWSSNHKTRFYRSAIPKTDVLMS